ncbi:MAG TPA: hypothetical protein VEX41_08495 [Candidatus Eisenbacteria bacterium]|nr:hypothetical protein [Candidatus Eisenbacteria bacterium]
MRINRRFLYAGTFLVALGGVLVATDLAAIDTAALTDVLRLWPLAVIVIGLGVVLRRNPQLSLSSGMLAAAVPGLVLGGAFAVAPSFTGDCGNKVEQAITQRQEGSFDGPATISVDGGCGSITITTAPGKAWRLEAGTTLGQAASLRASSRSLSIQSAGGEDLSFFSGGRAFWNVTLPTSQIDDLAVAVSAGTGQVDLPGARIGRLDLTGSLSQVTLDLSDASVEYLSGAINLGQLSVQLPAQSDLNGSVVVDGGMLEICSAPGAGLSVVATGSPRELNVEGVELDGSEWQSPDYESAAHKAEILVEVNFGAVEINPIGGCR